MPRGIARGLSAGFAVLTLALLVRGAPLLPLVAVGVAVLILLAVEILMRVAPPAGAAAPAAHEALLDTSVLIDGRLEAVATALYPSLDFIADAARRLGYIP